jgi:hypothetical protein
MKPRDSIPQIDFLRPIVRTELIQHFLQSLCILQQGGDVVKEDAFLWKIGNAADELLEFVHSKPHEAAILDSKKKGLQSRKSGHIIAARAGKHQTKSTPISFDIAPWSSSGSSLLYLALFGITTGVAKRLYTFVRLW